MSVCWTGGGVVGSGVEIGVWGVIGFVGEGNDLVINFVG